MSREKRERKRERTHTKTREMGVALCRAVNRTNEQGVETGVMESEGKKGLQREQN